MCVCVPVSVLDFNNVVERGDGTYEGNGIWFVNKSFAAPMMILWPSSFYCFAAEDSEDLFSDVCFAAIMMPGR